MQRMVGRVGLGALTLIAVLSTAGRASAQTITVTTTVTTVANNTTCTLPEAVEAINRQASYFGCSFTPSSAPDRVVLNVANVNPDVFTLDTPLTATRSMEILGQGQSATTISSGGIWAVAAVDGAVLSVLDLILERRPGQTLAVTGVRVEDGSTLELDNVLVRNFNATGIVVEGFTEESFATIVDSTIENNFGSGLHNTGGTIDIWNSAIRGNTTSDRGGGIHNSDDDGPIQSIIQVFESVIENNTAQGDGGGVYSGSTGVNARVYLFRSLLRNNVSNERGGGYFSNGQFTMLDTTVTENWANTDGAGIFHQVAELSIRNCTIAGNGGTRNGITTLLGGGVYADGGATTVYRSIIANNVASFSPDIFSPNAGGSYNLIENDSGAPGFLSVPEGGTNLIGVDPALGTLRSMGGPTMVLPLLAGSPAIDYIPSSVELSLSPGQTYPTDQRGSPRYKTQTPVPEARNGDSTGIGFDIGAFEQGIIETEFLTVAAKTTSISHTILNDSAYAKEQGARLNATANGHFVTYAIPVLSTGTYSFRIRARFGSNRGIYQVATANSLTGTYTNRGSQDFWAASPTFNEVTLGGATVTFSTTGTKYVRFTVTGRHPMATSNNLYLDWVQLVKQ